MRGSWARRIGLGRFLTGVAVVVVLSGAPFPPLHASMALSVLEDDDASLISRNDLEMMCKVLELTAEQSEAVKALHEAVQVEYRAALEQNRRKYKSLMLRSGGRWDSTTRAAWKTEGDRLAADFNRLESQFMSDLRSMLTDAQLADWPKVERRRLRQEQMEGGMIAGEGVDLVRIVDSSVPGLQQEHRPDGPNPPVEKPGDGAGDKAQTDKAVTAKISTEQAAEIRLILDRYESTVAPLLRQKVQLRRRFDAEYHGYYEARDAEGLASVLDPLRVVGRQLRDVNRRYARELAALLPEGTTGEFELQVRRATYGGIYWPSYAERVLDVAAKLGDLSAEQKENLTAIQEKHAQRLRGLNERMERAIEEQESSPLTQDYFERRRNDPMRQLWTERQDLDQATVRRVAALLTEPQREKLPEP